MVKSAQIFVVLVVLLAVNACGGDPGAKKLSPGQTLRVMASTPHLASIAMAVAGDKAEVEMLPGEGSSPHDYEPTVADRRRLQRAHLLLVNGLELESWDAPALAKAARAELVDCSHNLSQDWLISATEREDDKPTAGHDDHGHGAHDHGGHRHGQYDPHVWLSAEGAIGQARAIRDAMAAVDPANADAYGANFDDFEARINKLFDEYRLKVAALKKKKFVSNHDAFGYFARELELEQVGFIQRTPGHSPTVEERRKIEGMLKQGGADAIFMEPGFDDAASRVIAKNSGLPLATLDPFGVGKPAPNALEKVLRKNLDTVLETLGR